MCQRDSIGNLIPTPPLPHSLSPLHPHSPLLLTLSPARYRRDDGNFGAARKRSRKMLQKTYVFAVDIDVDELAQVAVRFTHTSAKARVLIFKFIQNLFDRAC